MTRINLAIPGMSCGHCVARVRKALASVPDLTVHRVDVGSADVEFDPARVSLVRVTEVLDEVGYPPAPAGNAA